MKRIQLSARLERAPDIPLRRQTTWGSANDENDAKGRDGIVYNVNGNGDVETRRGLLRCGVRRQKPRRHWTCVGVTLALNIRQKHAAAQVGITPLAKVNPRWSPVPVDVPRAGIGTVAFDCVPVCNLERIAPLLPDL